MLGLHSTKDNSVVLGFLFNSRFNGLGEPRDTVGKAELNRRAWVLQESVLARRTIHFTAKQIYFECGQGVYCENLVKLEW